MVHYSTQMFRSASHSHTSHPHTQHHTLPHTQHHTHTPTHTLSPGDGSVGPGGLESQCLRAMSHAMVAYGKKLLVVRTEEPDQVLALYLPYRCAAVCAAACV